MSAPAARQDPSLRAASHTPQSCGVAKYPRPTAACRHPAVPSMAVAAFSIASRRSPIDRRSAAAGSACACAPGTRRSSSDSERSHRLGFVRGVTARSPRIREEGPAASCQSRLTALARHGKSSLRTPALSCSAALCRQSPSLVLGAPRGPRMGEPGRGPAAPRSSDRNAGLSLFFPLPGHPAQPRGPRRRHSARKTKKWSACRPPLRFGPSARASGAVRSPPAGRSPSRSR